MLLTPNIFFPPLCILFIPAWLWVCVRRAYHWFSQDPWERCRSAVQCEGLFGYQTSSSNLCGVNLNISVSCRLPHRRKKKRRRGKRTVEYSSCSLYCVNVWPHFLKSVPLNGSCGWTKGLKCEQVRACQDASTLLSNIQFFQILKTCLRGHFWTRRGDWRQDFPYQDLFVADPP